MSSGERRQQTKTALDASGGRSHDQVSSGSKIPAGVGAVYIYIYIHIARGMGDQGVRLRKTPAAAAAAGG